MRSTSQRRLLCLPASGKPNTDIIIIFFSFFCIFFYNLTSLDLLANLLQTRAAISQTPVHSNNISPHWKICLSQRPTKLIGHSESRSPCSVQNKPKGVFMNTQQVNRSATVGSIRLSCSNVKLTCMTTSSLPRTTVTSKVGKLYKLNEVLWIDIIASKPFCIPLAVCFNSVLVSQRVLLHRPRKSTCSLQITTV